MILARSKTFILAVALAVFCAVGAFGATVNINFDEFTSPPVTCCYSDTGVIGPLVYPNVTITDGGNLGYVMNYLGWDNMQTSGDNLFGTLSGSIILTFNSGVSSLALDVINGTSASNFTLSLYGTGPSPFASYTQFLQGYTNPGSVGHFAPGDSGIWKAVITGNGDFAIDTVSFSTTPEPSSLLLLGSGVLGLAGVIRRKLSL